MMQVFLLPFLFLFLTSNIFAQLAGQLPLAPNSIPQFVDPLPHFAGIRVNAKTATNLWIKAVPHQQVAVSTGTVLATGTVGVTPGIGMANLWVYRISTNGTDYTSPLWPAFTIETERGNPLNVHYSNELTGETYSKVGLKVDHTLHWADPIGDMMPYDLEPPITVHLHGGEVPPLSDGGPDSWFTPGNFKTGHAFNGDGTTAYPYLYPNTQEAATLWFHDHALGVTRLNVYAGMAGFYFLRGPEEEIAKLPGWSGDDLVQEAAGGFAPAPYLPEIEIAIQDRMFDQNGALYFPNLPPNQMVHPFWTPEFVGDIITVNGKTWPYLSVAPRKYRFRILNGSNARTFELWLQNLATGVFGPVINQVGTDGGLLDAPVVINPALGQKLILMPGERADVVIDFSTSPAGTVWTVRNSGRAPYPNGAPPNGSTLGRIMQFVVNGTMVNANNPANPGTDKSELRTSLRTPLVKLTNFAGAPATGVTVAKTRQLTLNEVMGMGGPLEVLVNNTKWTGESVDPNRAGIGTAVTNGDGTITYYSETMDEGTTEVWKIINLTADAHPIHLHLVQFQLMSRQNFNVNKYNKTYNALFPASTAIDPMTGLPYPGGVFIGGYGPPLDYTTGNPIALGGNPDVTPYLQGPVKPANPNEKGWKDTFIMYPGQVTTVIARWAPTDALVNTPAADLWFPFDPNGGHGYVWHCHIIDHEDNEMMRPYNVTPNPNASNRMFAKQSGEIQVASVTDFSLDQNYPNPFNPSTVINFSVPKENTLVTLKIYNSIGEEVGTLINQVVPAGHHEVNFNARGLASGIYFYTLTAGNFVQSKKMVLLK
jgi:FtsP/CotA-like multicopper oxidase with cupredoxin domain